MNNAGADVPIAAVAIIYVDDTKAGLNSIFVQFSFDVSSLKPS